MNNKKPPLPNRELYRRILIIPPLAALFAYLMFLFLYGQDPFYRIMAMVCSCTALGWTTAVIHPVGVRFKLLYLWYGLGLLLPIPLVEVLLDPVGGHWYGRTVAMISLFGVVAIRGYFILFDADSDESD
jgi:hypothetical protein